MTEIALTVMISLVVILITALLSVVLSRKRRIASFPLKTIPDASSSRSSTSVPASSCSRSWKYDVFLSFRGEDTRKTFVDHLYFALVERVTCTYKDDITLSRGDTIGPSLFTAIENSQIALIIFSKNYSDSSWCLDELEYIMKCRVERGQIVIPIFYDVEPSEVRKQKGEFGKAFSKLIKEKNITEAKTESWKKALVDASNIAGWEPKNFAGGHEAKCIKDIVGTVLDKLLYLNSAVDENLVGMGTRFQDLKSHLNIGSGGVRMVGIWGIGGGGKTTLASSLYMEISSKFDSCCFLENIKEESSMKTLQEKILSTVLKIEVKVESVDIGKHLIKTRLGRKNVLLLLDDIDDRKQLEALAGSRDWFGDGSRIIITTRDEHLLRIHRVDQVSHVSLLSDEEAIRLFNRRAYNEDKLVEDYEMLSQRVVSYAAGLPLAIIVLGSFLYDKDKDEWISTLNRLKDIPEMEIVEKLKISYDGLKPLEKELFLDIACFYRRMGKDEAMVMLDACGFHPGIGVTVLMQKALITISKWNNHSIFVFDMHDLVQEMGHFIIRGEHPNNPEKHSRLWRSKEIEDMCSRNATKENDRTEAIQCYICPSSFGKLVSKAKKLRLLSVYNVNQNVIELPDYLSNELRYMYWRWYPASPLPESFQPRRLVVLKLEHSLQEELWRDYKYLPCLKELYLSDVYNLVRTPDFGGLPCLEKLTLENCEKLKEIHPSLGNHSSLVKVYVSQCEQLEEFPSIVQMGKLENLEISYCEALIKFPKIKANMDSLVYLSLRDVGIEALPLTVGKYCTKLRSLVLKNCHGLKSIEGNFHALKHLHKCKIIGGFSSRIKLPKDLFNEHIHLEKLHLEYTRQPSIFYLPRFIRRLTLSNCGMKDGEIPCDIGELSNLQELDLSGNEFSMLNVSLLQLFKLKFLDLSGCRKLVELPKLPTGRPILRANWSDSLEEVGGDRLLQTILQGNAIENGCMILKPKGVEIPKEFIPRVLTGNRYRLELPENWYNHFSGFLFCAAVTRDYDNWGQDLSLKHDKGGMDFQEEEEVCWEEEDIDDVGVTLVMKHDKGGMDSQEEDVYREESLYNDDVETWVGYISFGLLKHPLWWDPTSTSIEFSFKNESGSCVGFGVCLVSQTTETTDSSKSSDDNTCFFGIKSASKSVLEGEFRSYKY